MTCGRFGLIDKCHFVETDMVAFFVNCCRAQKLNLTKFTADSSFKQKEGTLFTSVMCDWLIDYSSTALRFLLVGRRIVLFHQSIDKCLHTIRLMTIPNTEQIDVRWLIVTYIPKQFLVRGPCFSNKLNTALITDGASTLLVELSKWALPFRRTLN